MTYEKRPLSSPDRGSSHHHIKRQHQSGIAEGHVELDNLLDLDTEIDFETAYQLFSNFDSSHEKGFNLFDQHTHPNDSHFNQEIRQVQTQLPSQSILPETPNTAFLNEVTNPLHGLSPLINNTGKTPHFANDHSAELSQIPTSVNNRQIPHTVNNPNMNISSNPLVPPPHMMDAMALQHLPNGNNILSPSPIMSPQFLNQPLHHTVQINQNMHELRNSINIANETHKPLQNPHLPQIPFSPRIAEELLQHTDVSHLPGSPNTQKNNDKLLSAFESTAIENFLDSLIDNQNANFVEQEETVPTKSPPLNPTPVVQKTEVTNPLDVNHDVTPQESADATPAEKEISEPSIAPFVPFNIPKPRDYVPPPLELPDIIIPDSDIPQNILSNEAKTKKWRHVQVEKIRRNYTKSSFEELTSMLSKKVGDNSKRVPKYLLLNAVVDDIKNILTANVELEKRVNEHQQ